MRTIPDIQADTVRVTNARRQIETTKRERLAAFKAALDEEFVAQDRDLYRQLQALLGEQDAVRAAEVSSPLEGKRVERVVDADRWGQKKTTERGVIVCVRSAADYPKRSESRRRFEPLPNVGEVIVQRLNPKGEKLTKWARVRRDGVLPHGWKLVD